MKTNIKFRSVGILLLTALLILISCVQPKDNGTDYECALDDGECVEFERFQVPTEDKEIMNKIYKDIAKEFPLTPIDKTRTIKGTNPSEAQIYNIMKEVGRQYNIPPEILYGVGYEESNLKQYKANGQPLISGDNGIGIMQVTPHAVDENFDEYSLKYNIRYNIEAGAQVILGKWRYVKGRNPIGNKDKMILENWYFALWAYNGYSRVNNPNAYNNGPRRWCNQYICWTRYAAYQDEVIDSITSRLGIAFTKLPKSWLPSSGIPSSGQSYSTPTPFHYSVIVGSPNIELTSLTKEGKDSNGNYIVSTNIKNTGNQNINTTFKVSLYIYGQVLQKDISNLNAGQSIKLTYNTNITAPGEYNYSILADSTGVISESEENDNKIENNKVVFTTFTADVPNTVIKGENMSFTGMASYPIDHVRIFVDGYLLTNNGIGDPIPVINNQYNLNYAFYSSAMDREVKVVAYNSSNDIINEIYKSINVLDEAVNFTIDIPDNITRGQEITFTGTASSVVNNVKIFVDGYQLIYNGNGNPINVYGGAYNLTYKFSGAGQDRQLTAIAYDSSGNALAELNESIDVTGGNGEFSLDTFGTIIKDNEITFSGEAPYPITKVKIFVDGYQLIYNGSGDPINVNYETYSFNYKFTSSGMERQLKVIGITDSWEIIDEVTTVINVYEDSSMEKITITIPPAVYTDETTRFHGTITSNIVDVNATIDGYTLPNPVINDNKFSFNYSFTLPAQGRVMELKGYDADYNLVETIQRTVDIHSKETPGEQLQKMLKERMDGIAPHNRPYVFNGVQDCYGYCRQVWNAVLYDGGAHEEDYYPNSYNTSRWLNVSGGLPVADAPSSNWALITDYNDLVPGDVLSTHQGHAWGAHWHGGLYYGKVNGVHYVLDNSKRGNKNGAYVRTFYTGFKYYYKPTHNMLTKQY